MLVRNSGEWLDDPAAVEKRLEELWAANGARCDEEELWVAANGEESDDEDILQILFQED